MPVWSRFTMVFGKSHFRPFQREIITSALEGNDVFVQAATSFGKSLCYQLPAVIDHGITIVVSPLLALMGNQVAALKAANIAVATINSNTPFADRDEIIKDLSCGHPTTRLLYVTPELVLTETFRKVLGIVYSQGELARVAIDEAHCISEWGHEFRPAYRQLSHFRANYPLAPIICLTATAAPSIRADVLKNLGLLEKRTKIFTTTTARRNLHYQVQFTSDDSERRFEWLLSFLQGMYERRTSDADRSAELKSERSDAVSGIIYVSLRSDCDVLAQRLRNHDIGATSYHAGLSPHDRANFQQRWLANAKGYDIIVATTAFGMGIDKQDVRFVIHWTLPKSFEGFYQEAGRAGRDGKAALCVLFYSREDRDRVGHRIAQGEQSKDNHGTNRNRQAQQQARITSFQDLVKYAEQTDRCRHLMIGEFFGEKDVQPCNAACDACFQWPGQASLPTRKEEGLSSEEWVSTQRGNEDFYRDEYD